MLWTRRFSGLGFAVLGLVLSSVAMNPASADDAHTLTLYNARHAAGDGQLYQLFTKTTGIKVKLVPGKPEELLQRIKLEAETSPADLFIAADGSYLWQPEKDNLFQSITSPDLTANIPAALHDPKDRWFGFAWRARVIVYDKTKVSQKLLSTYEGLVTPKFQGQILVRPVTSIDNQSLVAGMIEAIGAEKTEAWVKGLVQNFARTPRGDDTDQLQAIVDGLGSVAISNTNYFARLLAQAKPETQVSLQRLAIFFPNQQDQGASINISAAAVAAHAPHKDNAVKFLQFLLSPMAQRLISDLNYEYPVRSDVPLNAYLAAWGPFKTDDLHVQALSENNLSAIQLMERLGWR